MQSCTFKLVNRAFFFFFSSYAAKTHIRIRGRESEKQTVSQTQSADLFVCAFRFVVNTEYRLHIPIMDFALIGFTPLLFFYLILDLPLEKSPWCLLYVTESYH